MANNAAALRTLDRFIADLRSTKGIGKALAPQLAPIVKAEVDAAIAAGHGLDGTPWPARKDGGKPLVNAAKAVSVRAIGSAIVITLTGPEVFHQFGAGSLPVRAILPVKGLPFKLGNAIRKGIVSMGLPFMQHTKGARMTPSMKGGA